MLACTAGIFLETGSLEVFRRLHQVSDTLVMMLLSVVMAFALSAFAIVVLAMIVTAVRFNSLFSRFFRGGISRFDKRGRKQRNARAQGKNPAQGT